MKNNELSVDFITYLFEDLLSQTFVHFSRNNLLTKHYITEKTKCSTIILQISKY